VYRERHRARVVDDDVDAAVLGERFSDDAAAGFGVGYENRPGPGASTRAGSTRRRRAARQRERRWRVPERRGKHADG